MQSIMDGVSVLTKGGPVMALLLIASLVVVAIGIDRFLYFLRHDTGRDFAEDFCERIAASDYAGARDVAARAKGDIAGLIRDGIRRIEDGAEGVSSYLEVTATVTVAHFKKRLYYLSVIVTLAPLMGLLGTISGMMSSFSILSIEAGEAGGITGGVAEALIATATGLFVAIVALIVHAYFAQRSDSILTDLEETSTALVGAARHFRTDGGEVQ